MNILKSIQAKKTIMRSAAVVLLAIAGLSACESPITEPPADGTAVTGISLNKAIISLTIGGTEQLAAIIAPETATNKAVTWASSSASASVSATGLVTAVSVGTATIKATSTDGSFAANCVVTVASRPVTGVSLNKATTSIGLGMTEQLTATISPANATNKAVSWMSTSANATVSATGLVTAVAIGSATIRATSADGSFTASCVVTVTPVSVTGISLSSATLTLAAGRFVALNATVNPTNATNKNVIWTSSNDSVAYAVDGQVIALAAGTATITATTEDGAFKASCLVTVTGALAHTYAEIQPAATALQNGLNAASLSSNPALTAYSVRVLTPSDIVTCYLNNYVNSGYTLNGTVVVNVIPVNRQGPMNGTVLFTGGIVTEISYSNAIFAFPMSGSLGIKFSDATSGTVNLATGTYTQN